MATRIKSNQIADNTIVAADLHSAIAINTTQSGTFGSVIVDNITIDGSSLATSGTNDFTVDSGGLIVLDADSTYGDIRLANSSSQYAALYNSGDHFYVKSIINEGDVYLSGKDSTGAHIDGLRLDFGNSGDATFNAHVKMNTGSSTGKFAVMSTGVHGSYDFYNNGTSYLNGSTIVDDVLQISDTTTSTSTSSGSLQVSGGAGIAENLNVGGNVVITGDLTVEGSQVTLETTALDVEDKNITLNYHATNDTSASADNAGITIQDAVSQGNDATILWDTTDDKFDFSHSIHASGELRHYNTYNSATESLGTRLIADAGSTSYTHPQVDMRRWTGSAQDHYTASIELSPTNADGHALVVMSDTQTSNTKATTERFRIDNTGNVGIGDFSSTAPAQPLHVDGATKSKNLYLTNTSNSSQSDAFIYWSDGSGTSELTFDANSTSDSNIKFNTSEPGGSGRNAMWLQGDDWEDGGQSTTVYGRLKLKDGYGSTGAYENGQVRHSVRPSLLLDFANSKQLDPRMSFTRSSTGLYWDGKTTVKAEENLIMGSNDLTTGWSYNNVQKTTGHTAPDGTSTAVGLDEDSTANTFFFGVESISAYSSSDYVFSVYAKANERSAVYMVVRVNSGSKRYAVNFDLSNGTFIDDFNYGGATGVAYAIESVGNGWYRCSVTAHNESGDVIICTGPNNGGTLSDINGAHVGTVGHGIYAWGAQLEQRSSPTQYNQTTTVPISKFQSVLKSAHVNSPRFDHDPVTGESKGLLIEESRTNYAPYSTPNSNWIQAAHMVSPNYAIAPDGTHTAAFIHESATSRQQLAYTHSGTTLTSGSTYTFSAYAKAYTHDTFQMHSYGDSSKTFYLSNPSNDGDSTMTHVGNGWYRCTWTKTKSNTTSTIYLGFDGASYAGDANKGLLFWGAQVELGTFATSLIPTVGSTNTRALDDLADYNLQYSGRQSWFSSYKGTMFADYTLFGDYVDAPYPRIHVTTIVGSRTSIEMMHYGGNVQHHFFLDNSLKLNQSRAVAVNNKISGAMSWDFNQSLASSAINGSATNNTITGVPHQLDRIHIGTSGWNGHIRKFAFYRDHFSNAELVALTEE